METSGARSAPATMVGAGGPLGGSVRATAHQGGVLIRRGGPQDAEGTLRGRPAAPMAMRGCYNLSFSASSMRRKEEIRDDCQAPFHTAPAGFPGARRPGRLSRPASRRRLLFSLLSDPP